MIKKSYNHWSDLSKTLQELSEYPCWPLQTLHFCVYQKSKKATITGYFWKCMEKLPLGLNLNCTWMTIGWHFTTCTGTFFLWITNQPRWSPLGPYQKFCFKSLHWNNWTIQRRLIYEFTETTGPLKGDLSMSLLV
jgi:hypothetical protein